MNTQYSLLAGNKLRSIQIETLAKKLDGREVAQLSVKATCDFCE